MKKQFTLRIDMNNAAFDDDGENGTVELHNLLERVKAAVDRADGNPGEWGVIHDTNGNPVGQWHFKRTRRS